MLDAINIEAMFRRYYLRLLVISEGIIIIFYQRSLSTREKLIFDG